MALKVKAATGETFHRCGMKFTGDPIIVSNEKLRTPFGTPEPSKKNPATVGEILRGEQALVCEEL